MLTPLSRCVQADLLLTRVNAQLRELDGLAVTLRHCVPESAKAKLCQRIMDGKLAELAELQYALRGNDEDEN